MALEIIPPAEGKDWALLKFTGRLDADSVEDFRTRIQQVIDSNGGRLIGDFSGLKYISSAGINLLIFVHRQALAARGDFRVAGLQHYVAETLKLAGVTKFFRLYESVEAAGG